MTVILQPQTSAKLVGGYGTAVDHVLAMAFDDPWMDDDLRRTLNAQEVVLDEEWPDEQPQVVVLAVWHLFDSGHPATGAVEADGRGLSPFAARSRSLCGFQRRAQLVDGLDGSRVAADVGQDRTYLVSRRWSGLCFVFSTLRLRLGNNLDLAGGSACHRSNLP